MNIFGKRLGDYILFGKTMLALTLVVGLTRLGLSLAGVANSVAVWFSMTALTLLGVVVFPIQVHRNHFGTYRHVFVLLAIQLALTGVITALGITIAGITGVDNIFAHGDGNHLGHALQHLLGGPTITAFLLWLPSALILFAARRIHGSRRAPAQ